MAPANHWLIGLTCRCRRHLAAAAVAAEVVLLHLLLPRALTPVLLVTAAGTQRVINFRYAASAAARLRYVGPAAARLSRYLATPIFVQWLVHNIYAITDATNSSLYTSISAGLFISFRKYLQLHIECDKSQGQLGCALAWENVIEIVARS